MLAVYSLLELLAKVRLTFFIPWGKVMLYQLSYCRKNFQILRDFWLRLSILHKFRLRSACAKIAAIISKTQRLSVESGAKVRLLL
ncbi:MAG: hypothetical protein IKT80_06465 [Bacteroidaceae bacterium]|nr:hypothetical protein [Bacteroidaceae bacterium]